MSSYQSPARSTSSVAGARSVAASPSDRIHELLLQLQSSPRSMRSAPGSASKGVSSRLTPAQFRSRRPARSPGFDSAADSDTDSFIYDTAAEDARLSNPLDQSGELDDDELHALIATASSLTGLTPAKKGSRNTAAVVATNSIAIGTIDEDNNDDDGINGAGDEEDDLGSDANLSNAALQEKIASERAVLGDLISKLSALQSQAAQLKQMSDMSRAAQAEMRSLMETGDSNISELEAEKQALQAQLDQLQADGDDDDQLTDEVTDSDDANDIDEEDDDDEDAEDGYASGSPGPSESELEVEIEHSRDQPVESEDSELDADTRQLAQLEELMASLASTANEHRRRARHDLTAEEAEREEEEAEVDARLFFGRDSHQQQHSERGRTRTATRYAYEEDEEEARRRQQARRQDASSSPRTSASGSPSPPRRTARPVAQTATSSTSSPPSTIFAVPASRVPPVPISRWIGPSTLPSAAPGGGSGRHAVYTDRPATAVGTTRGAVRGGGGGGRSYPSHYSSSIGSSPSSSASWQAPTLSSLPVGTGGGSGPGRAGGAKKTSLSSRSSLFVNAPESEVSTPPSERSAPSRGDRRYEAHGIAEEEDSDEDQENQFDTEEEDEEDEEDDDDAYSSLPASHAQSRADPAESPLPSDSDSELPYAINAAQAQWQAAAASRPKSARQAAAAHLNGRTTNGAAVSHRAAVPVDAPTAFEPTALSPADLQSVLASIGAGLFRSTINIGSRAKPAAAAATTTTNGTPMLGAGRLGQVQATSEQQQQPRSSGEISRPRRQERGQYGFAPAMPQRAWQ